MKKLLLLLISLLFTTFAYGEWTKVGFGDESTMFIDSRTIKRTGDLVRVMYLLNFPLSAKSPDNKITYKSSKTLEEFDCKKGLSRTLSFEWYSGLMGGGDRLYQDAQTYPYEKVTDGSLVNGVKKKVCG